MVGIILGSILDDPDRAIKSYDPSSVGSYPDLDFEIGTGILNEEPDETQYMGSSSEGTMTPPDSPTVATPTAVDLLGYQEAVRDVPPFRHKSVTIDALHLILEWIENMQVLNLYEPARMTLRELRVYDELGMKSKFDISTYLYVKSVLESKNDAPDKPLIIMGDRGTNIRWLPEFLVSRFKTKTKYEGFLGTHYLLRDRISEFDRTDTRRFPGHSIKEFLDETLSGF